MRYGLLLLAEGIKWLVENSIILVMLLLLFIVCFGVFATIGAGLVFLVAIWFDPEWFFVNIPYIYLISGVVISAIYLLIEWAADP